MVNSLILRTTVTVAFHMDSSHKIALHVYSKLTSTSYFVVVCLFYFVFD